MIRTRNLTDLEQLAIDQADTLQRTLAAIRDDSPTDQADREAIDDAMSHCTALIGCLDDIAKPDDICSACGAAVDPDDVWCSKCETLFVEGVPHDDC